MAEKKAFHRSKFFYILSCLSLILLITGFLFWRNYKYKLVNKKLDKLITVKSRGLYQLNYKNLIINETLGNLSAENVEMIPDSLVYQMLIDQKTAPENLFYLRIPKLTITGVKTPRALLNKEISAHIIKIENAEIEIRLNNENKEKKPGFNTKMRSDLYRLLLGKLTSIKADSLILENANLTLVDIKSKAVRCKAEGLSLRFSGVAIDSLIQNDSSEVFFSRNLAVHLNQLELPVKNKLYSFRVDGLDFNTQTNHLHTDQIKWKPLLSETDFAKANNYAIDRLDIRIGNLDIWKIRLQALITMQLTADSIQLSDASFRIFRDNSFKHDSVDRTHNYPQEAIMRLPFSIYVSKIIVKEGYIEYKEKNDISDSSGKVTFFNVQAVFKNVTNMLSYIKLNNQMSLLFNASFLNETVFNANIKMRLNDWNGNFQLDARMGEIKTVSLNPLLKPIALAEFDKGKISGLRFHLDATNIYGKGRLDITYNDLGLKLLKKNENKNKYKTKLLPTLAAGLELKDSNPQNGKTRTGNVVYNRDIHRSIFNMMWKTLFACIKQVAL
ncbi:MAG TPA: hypothetical protein VGZ90_16730 [Puia sp.]|jgi:hypothetical protein|nr:hypothetical protein [Puia sp.]